MQQLKITQGVISLWKSLPKEIVLGAETKFSGREFHLELFLYTESHLWDSLPLYLVTAPVNISLLRASEVSGTPHHCI